MREDAYTKAGRLLTEGRLTIRGLANNRVEAIVRGDSSSLYRVRHLPGAGWACTCDARSHKCSHIIAAMRVTVVDDRRQP